MLSGIPDNIWPTPEFELESTIDFTNAFAGCISVSGTVPMYKLWYGEVYWNPSNTNAFAECSGLTNYNYIPINWGGKGDAYTNLDFELTIPEGDKNRTFALPIHKTYTAYDFQVDTNNKNSLTSLDVNAQCKILINWGDGTDESYVHVNNTAKAYNTYWINDYNSIYYNYPVGFPNEANPNGNITELLSGLCHTYEKPGKYKVSVIDASNYYDKRFNIYVEEGPLSGLYKLTNEFETEFNRIWRNKNLYYIKYLGERWVFTDKNNHIIAIAESAVNNTEQIIDYPTSTRYIMPTLNYSSLPASHDNIAAVDGYKYDDGEMATLVTKNGLYDDQIDSIIIYEGKFKGNYLVVDNTEKYNTLRKWKNENYTIKFITTLNNESYYAWAITRTEIVNGNEVEYLLAITDNEGANYELDSIPCGKLFITPTLHYMELPSEYSYFECKNGSIPYVLDTLYVHPQDTWTWRHLTRIYNPGLLNIKSFENSFANAVNLKRLPNLPLIRSLNVINLAHDNMLSLCTNAQNTFLNCHSLSHIPINFKLDKNLLNMGRMFKNCFYYDINDILHSEGFNVNTDYSYIERYKNSLIPTQGFNSFTDITVTEMFDNCSGMTREVNGYALWQSQTITYNSNNCFRNCISLDNYNLIPFSWGGLNQTSTMFENDETFIFEIKIPEKLFNANDEFTVTLPLAEYYIDETNELNENILEYHYNFNIDWGDDTTSVVTKYNDSNATHTYKKTNSNIFKIKIYGLFEGWNIWNNIFSSFITKIEQWGDINIKIYKQFLMNCVNLKEIPQTFLPVQTINKANLNNKADISWARMFKNCYSLDISNYTELPILNLNLDEINSIDISEIFYNIFNTIIPTTLLDIPKFKLKCMEKYVIFKYNTVFSSSQININIDNYLNTAKLIDNFSALSVLNSCAINSIRKKLDYTNKNEIEKQTQISALVYDNETKEYYIYPRYMIDDLIYNKFFLKHPAIYNGTDGLNLAFLNCNKLTRYGDKKFEIIFENINNPVKFNFEKYIKEYNDAYSKMQYVPDSYNEKERTFKLSYEDVLNTKYIAKYSFDSIFPIEYEFADLSDSSKISVNINDYNIKTGFINTNIPTEETIRFTIDNNIESFGWNLPKTNVRYIPNLSKINKIKKDFTYINELSETKSEQFECSDYYQILNNVSDATTEELNNLVETGKLLSCKFENYEDIFYNDKLAESNEFLSNILARYNKYIFDNNDKTKGFNEIFKNHNLIDIDGFGFGRTIETVEGLVLPEQIQSAEYLFYNYSEMSSIWDKFIFPTNLTNINYMFYNCSGLISLPESFNNLKKLKQLKYSFYNCSSLSGDFKLNIKSDISFKFNGATNLEVIDLQHTFEKCTSISNYIINDGKELALQYPIILNSTFKDNDSLIQIPSNLTNIYYNANYTFENCNSLKTIDVTKLIKSDSTTTYNTENLIGMFKGCENLNNVAGVIPNTIINMSQMFMDCTNLTTVESSFFNLENYFENDEIYLNQMFENCENLTGNFTGNLLWNNLTVTFISDDTFKNCTKLENNVPDSWK
jgi:hypothetical protein